MEYCLERVKSLGNWSVVLSTLICKKAQKNHTIHRDIFLPLEQWCTRISCATLTAPSFCNWNRTVELLMRWKEGMFDASIAIQDLYPRLLSITCEDNLIDEMQETGSQNSPRTWFFPSRDHNNLFYLEEELYNLDLALNNRWAGPWIILAAGCDRWCCMF